MAGRFSVETVFKLVDKMSAPISRIQNRVNKFTRSAGKGFRKLNRSVDKFSRSIQRASAVTAASLLVVGTAMGNVISTGADFERALGSAAAKFPDQIQRGTKEFKALSDAAREVGKTTEFTSTQAAQGLNFLAKAGFNAKFSVKALADIVDFATAAEISFAEAADVASDSLGAFGLDSENLDDKMKGLRRVMDVMSMTANSTNVSISELFESIKDGGPISTAAGVSVETFAATMGFLANSGIKASKAGTAAKNITLALAGVGNKAEKTFKRLGISLSDSSGDLRDQFDVLDELRQKISGFGKKQQVTIIESIFGKIPIASAALLLGDVNGKVRDLRKELEKAGGSSRRTAQFIRNDVKGSLDSLASSVEGVKISIFTMNRGPLKEAIDNMTDWVRANEKLIATRVTEFITHLIDNIDNLITTIKKIASVIIIVLSLSLAFKALAVTIAIVNTTLLAGKAVWAAAVLLWTGLPKVLAAARLAILAFNLALTLNPIGVAVTAIGLLIAAVAAIFVAWEPVKAFFMDLWDTVKTVASGIGDFFSAIGEVFDFGFKKEVKVEVVPVIEPISPEMLKVAEKNLPLEVQQIFDKTQPTISPRVDNVSPIRPEVVQPTISPMVDKMEPVITEITPVVADMAPIVPEVTQPVITPILDKMGKITPEVEQPSIGSRGFSPSAGLDNVINFPQNTGESNIQSDIVTPQDRIARTVDEQRTTNSAEVLIRDETGRAEVQSNNGRASGVKLQRTGTF